MQKGFTDFDLLCTKRSYWIQESLRVRNWQIKCKSVD